METISSSESKMPSTVKWALSIHAFYAAWAIRHHAASDAVVVREAMTVSLVLTAVLFTAVAFRQRWARQTLAWWFALGCALGLLDLLIPHRASQHPLDYAGLLGGLFDVAATALLFLPSSSRWIATPTKAVVQERCP